MTSATYARRLGLVTLVALGGACKESSKPAGGVGSATSKPASDAGAGSGGGAAIDSPVAAAPTVDAAPAARPPTGYRGALASSVALGGGATLWLGFHERIEVNEVAELDQLVLRLERDGKPVWQRDGFLAIADFDEVPDTFTYCDSIMSAIEQQTWGEASGVRLSVACRQGADYYTGTELAILLELDASLAEPFPPMWAGEADILQSENDACVTTTTVTFKVAGTEMTRTEVDHAEGCKRKKAKRTERVTVPRRGGAAGGLPAALTRVDGNSAMGFRIDDELTIPTDPNLVVKTVDPEHVEIWVAQERQLAIRVEGVKKIIAEIEVVGRLPRLERGLGVGSKASDLDRALGEPLFIGGVVGHPQASWDALGLVAVQFTSEAGSWPELLAENAVVTSLELFAPGEDESEEE